MTESPEESPRRGRPSSPSQNALGEYLRELRTGRGWTIRELAREVGLSDSAAGYISQLESGTKSLNPDLAKKLVERLGDPKGIFPLWAQIGARMDPYRAALARRALAHVLGDPSINFDPRFSRPGRTRFEQGGVPKDGADLTQLLRRYQEQNLLPRSFVGAALPPPGPALERMQHTEDWQSELMPYAPEIRPDGYSYRVPIAPLDRHPYLVPRTMEEMVSLDLPRTVMYPVAYRMDERSVRRVRNIVEPGDVVVLAREDEPIVEHEIYAVWAGDTHTEGRIELAHVLYNGQEVLILPGPGQSDFVVHKTRHPYRYVVGHMVTIVRPPAAS
jgi:transcriptional regulator with XRE-family HTH domain